MRSSEYRGPIAWLGGSAVFAVVFGLLFRALSPVLFPPGIREQVIVQAIPFVGIFAALILLFILSITLASIRFRRIIPGRTHRPVELLTIAGILLGIVALFQPWHLGPYTFGFGLVLISTLAYIFWSHIEPRGARDSGGLPDFTRRARTFGVIAGVAVAIAVFWLLAVAALPDPPYGMFPRQFDRLSDAEQAAAATEALRQYRIGYLPFLALYSALPGLIAWFLTREAVTLRGAGAGDR
jgi:lysylphosphatidylglycerol synthetase-like protein (DUF2156 family)